MPHASVPAVPERPASYVISLRPAGEHATLERAAAAHGLGLIALSPWRIVHRDDPAARTALAAALDAPVTVFTSPPAVAAAAALMLAVLAWLVTLVPVEDGVRDYVAWFRAYYGG